MKFLIALAFSILLTATSCNTKQQDFNIQAGEELLIDSLPGSCPYITKDNHGNPVVGWARELNDSSSVFCYAISKDDGKSFGTPIVIPHTSNIQPHAENLPKLIFKPSGEIIALWGVANSNPNNKYSGLVYYSQSFDDGKTWNNPRLLVKDISSYDQRYYDVALEPRGEVAVVWLDNRKKSNKEGSALYFATTQGNQGFTNERMITEGCCQCCRTDLFIDSSAGIHILYRGIIQDSIRDMLHTVSVDGGNNFSTPKRISNDNWVIRGCPHTGPAMTANKEGLHFAWFTGGAHKGCFYTRSTDNGNNFINHDRISDAGSHPQIASTSNGELVTCWDENVQVNNKYYKRIGIELRSVTGKELARGLVTADTSTAAYPVIATIKEQRALVAYTIKKGDKSYVTYQLVNL